MDTSLTEEIEGASVSFATVSEGDIYITFDNEMKLHIFVHNDGTLGWGMIYDE